MPPRSVLRKPSAKSSPKPAIPPKSEAPPESIKTETNTNEQGTGSLSDTAMEVSSSQICENAEKVVEAEKDGGDVEEKEDSDPEEDPEEEVGEDEDKDEAEEGGEGEGEEETKEATERIKEKRKQREFEVFVGGLARDATEEDLEKVFKKVGEVVEVRLVKNTYTNKNKGFAFVRFATVEQAKRAATELKHTQVKGKACGVIKSNDNETLHLGNICTAWTKDDLVEKLKAFELENLEEVHLIDDPKNKGMNRGYAFLDFSTHMDAVAACSKLQRRDIFFGTDVRAEVSFSKTVEPDEEVMSQVKSVFLDGFPATWDENEVREQFKKFGEIENVQLACNMPTARRKDFGFISFTTREAALDCIEKVNANGVGEGAEKVLVKATLKKPLQRRMPPKLGVRTGYIGKSSGWRKQQPYGNGHSFPARPARSREFMGRGRSDSSMGPSRFSPRRDGFREALSPSDSKYGARFRREFIREVPGPAIASSRSRDPYLESSTSGRHALANYRDFSPTYSRSREAYSDADAYDTRLEYYEDYEYPSLSGYKRSYSEIDGELLASSSVTRRSRVRSPLEMDTFPHHAGSTYEEYSRFYPDGHVGYDRVEYASREYGSRYSSRSGASRSYY